MICATSRTLQKTRLWVQACMCGSRNEPCLLGRLRFANETVSAVDVWISRDGSPGSFFQGATARTCIETRCLAAPLCWDGCCLMEMGQGPRCNCRAYWKSPTCLQCLAVVFVIQTNAVRSRHPVPLHTTAEVSLSYLPAGFVRLKCYRRSSSRHCTRLEK